MTQPQPLKTNDIKKGWIVRDIRNLEYTVADNQRGDIRMVNTNRGFHPFQELGSMYAVAWKEAKPTEDAPWQPVELTPKQIKSRKELAATGMI